MKKKEEDTAITSTSSNTTTTTSSMNHSHTMAATTAASVVEPHDTTTTQQHPPWDDTWVWYQNHRTGQVVAETVSLRQFCRMVGSIVVSSTTTTTPQHLTPETNVWCYIRRKEQDDGGDGDDNNNDVNIINDGTGNGSSHLSSSNDNNKNSNISSTNNSETGWKPLRTIPVLREVVTLWYCYHHHHDDAAAAGEDGAIATPDVVHGPMSCRELAQFLDTTTIVASSSPGTVYVSSVVTDMTWRTLEQCPPLQWALSVLSSSSSSSSLVSPDVVVETTRKEETSTTTNTNTTLENSNVMPQAEFDAFLQSTTSGAKKRTADDDDDACSYESDQGTRYVRDRHTGNWVHEALVVASSSLSSSTAHSNKSNRNHPDHKNKKNQPNSNITTVAAKKPKFANKYGRNWIYVTGLPTTPDLTEEQVAAVFEKAGILDLDPVTQSPKIKLYRAKTSPDQAQQQPGALKGDASICYARPESVTLAMTLLDDTPFCYNARLPPDQQVRMTVQAAKFQAHDDDATSVRHTSQRHVSQTQRQVAKLAAQQAMDWDEQGNYNNGRITGGKKGLCIIVLKNTFDPKLVSSEDHDFWSVLEQDLRTECEVHGTVEKITVFTSHTEGVAIVKFVQPLAASDAVRRFHRQTWKNRTVRATFWDGVTDYTPTRDVVQEEKEMAVREEEFGDWLETQELPEELRLQTLEPE